MSSAKALGEDAVAKAAVADRQAGLAQLLQDRPHDARAGKDDLRALRLKTDDGAAGLGVARPVKLDLAVDFVASMIAPWTRDGS